MPETGRAPLALCSCWQPFLQDKYSLRRLLPSVLYSAYDLSRPCAEAIKPLQSSLYPTPPELIRGWWQSYWQQKGHFRISSGRNFIQNEPSPPTYSHMLPDTYEESIEMMEHLFKNLNNETSVEDEDKKAKWPLWQFLVINCQMDCLCPLTVDSDKPSSKMRGRCRGIYNKSVIWRRMLQPTLLSKYLPYWWLPNKRVKMRYNGRYHINVHHYVYVLLLESEALSVWSSLVSPNLSNHFPWR